MVKPWKLSFLLLVEQGTVAEQRRFKNYLFLHSDFSLTGYPSLSVSGTRRPFPKHLFSHDERHIGDFVRLFSALVLTGKEKNSFLPSSNGRLPQPCLPRDVRKPARVSVGPEPHVKHWENTTSRSLVGFEPVRCTANPKSLHASMFDAN